MARNVEAAQAVEEARPEVPDANFVSYRTDCIRLASVSSIERAHMRERGWGSSKDGGVMKTLIVVSVLTLGLASPAFAAGTSQEKYFVTVDTVGNCSLVRSDGTLSAGKKPLGNADGYESMEDAKKFLDEIRNDQAKCKGVVAG